LDCCAMTVFNRAMHVSREKIVPLQLAPVITRWSADDFHHTVEQGTVFLRYP
jgi:hypothetical protein